jgi:imidazolonepropionase
MTLVDADKVVIENLSRVVTCAPGEGGPLIGRSMRNLGTLAGDLCIGIEDGRVAYIGERDELPVAFADAHIHDGGGFVCTPGLVDCHTHPAFARSRADEFALRLSGATYEEIAEAGGGIVSSTRAVREATDKELTEETARNLLRLRRHGVVVAEGKSGYGLTLEDELRQLRAIRDAGEASNMLTVGTCLAAHSVPMEYREQVNGREKYLELVTEEILPAVIEEKLAERADIFCERNVFDAAETERFAERAAELGLRLTIHADQLSDSGAAGIAAKFEADSADHLEYLSDESLEAMRETGTVAVLLPGSTYVLKMDQWADGLRIREQDVCIALATDFNPGSSPVANPAFVMNLAVMHCGLKPNEAIAAFTVNAAHALRLNTDEWGVIKIGSRAAFALWDVDHEREIPYYAGSNMCIEVITCRGWR